MGRLDGRIAVITGAGRGIGAEIAKLMAREGAKVVVNDLGGNTDGTGTGKIADDVVARNPRSRRRSGLQHAVDRRRQRRRIAACRPRSTRSAAWTSSSTTPASCATRRSSTWKSRTGTPCIAVHLKGHYCCSRPFAKYIRDQNRTNCRIVNFSSTSGLFGNFGQANYGAAKAGIAGFTRVLALELAKYGCTVNTISPGALTRMTIPLREARGEKVKQAELDAGGPQHIAPLVAWLASESASGVSNQILHAARGSIGIMQQPAIIKSFQKTKAPWTLAELDRYVPMLIEARKTHDAAVKARRQVRRHRLTHRSCGRRLPPQDAAVTSSTSSADTTASRRRS